MSGQVTIVMYHYVRDYQVSAYPGINGLDVRDFASQIGYFARYYVFVTLEECWNALDGKNNLPENAVLLTFDDGYADHYEYVFPLLKQKGIQGTFFVPAGPCDEKVVLDVNKIHFILASSPDPSILLKHLLTLMSRKREQFGLEDPQAYVSTITDSFRFGSQEVLIFKRLLQRTLPSRARKEIIGEMFADFVTADERSFSERLYLSESQMKEMSAQGMAFGHHYSSHEWLPTLSRARHEEELAKGLDLLNRIGARTDKWAVSYPYGAHDAQSVEMPHAQGCVMGVTITPAIARLDPIHRMVLPRLDTNDFPRNSDAPPNAWTLQVLSHKGH